MSGKLYCEFMTKPNTTITYINWYEPDKDPNVMRWVEIILALINNYEQKK